MIQIYRYRYRVKFRLCLILYLHGYCPKARIFIIFSNQVGWPDSAEFISLKNSVCNVYFPPLEIHCIPKAVNTRKSPAHIKLKPAFKDTTFQTQGDIEKKNILACCMQSFDCDNTNLKYCNSGRPSWQKKLHTAPCYLDQMTIPHFKRCFNFISLTVKIDFLIYVNPKYLGNYLKNIYKWQKLRFRDKSLFEPTTNLLTELSLRHQVNFITKMEDILQRVSY